MKRLLLAPLILILLTSCQSKKDICASWSASQIKLNRALTNKEAAKKLGINLDHADNWLDESDTIRAFCKYYTN